MTDKPDSLHAEYEQNVTRWERCRDAMAGQDAVHKAGEKYLPALSDQKPAEYLAYKLRTPFYPASGRTWQGLVGMVFRQAPHIENQDSAADLIADATLSGVSATLLARRVLGEVEEVGRCGVLVEYPVVVQQPASLAEASQKNLRPYATFYKAESIINWRVERVNNRMQPTLVVLRECHEEVGSFEVKQHDQLRVLLLEAGIYLVRIYRKSTEKGEWELVEQIVPTRNGAPLESIPFFPFGSEENSLHVQAPPLLDLVDMNLSHYRTTADLEHGAHFTGLPMLFLAGVRVRENEKISLGSQTAIVADDPTADGKFIEFTGQGLGALEKLLDRKEDQMAAIGARMLAPEKKAAEAEDTVKMRHSGESSVLASQAELVSDGMEKMLNLMREWAGLPGAIVFRLSTDFIPGRMSPQELDALVKSWQAGAISKQTLFANLQMGEIVEPDKVFEDEEAEIAEGAPQLGTMEAPEDGAQ
jgi:hypothetical protein